MNKSNSTIKGFGVEWTRWGTLSRLYRNEQELIDEFNRYNIPKNFFKNKKVLDAGCGMGRYVYLASKLGAKEVIGLEPGDGVNSAKQLTKDLNNVSIIRGNIFSPPFRPQSFDSIMSIGVLHHTGNTHKAFKKLVKLLKPGGKIFIQVYMPRKGTRKYWYAITRKITSKMSNKQIYTFSFLLCAVKLVPRYVKYLITRYPMQKFSRNVADTFDWYCCDYQDFHTYDEIIQLYKEAGLKNIQLTNPNYWLAVNIIGEK